MVASQLIMILMRNFFEREVSVSKESQKNKTVTTEAVSNAESRKNRMVGKQSIEFGKPIRIQCSASIVGKKEGQGPLGKLFDKISMDDMFGGNSWEEVHLGEAPFFEMQWPHKGCRWQQNNREIKFLKYIYNF